MPPIPQGPDYNATFWSFEKSFENFLNKTITKIFKGLFKGPFKEPKLCIVIGTLILTLIKGAIGRYLGYFEERSIPGDYGITVSLNIGVAQIEDLANLNIDNVWAGKPLALNRHGEFGL